MTYLTRIGTSFLVGLVLSVGAIAPFASPAPAHGKGMLVVPVYPPTTDAIAGGLAATEVEESIVEQVLNGIAWAVAKAAVQAITQSIVTWINSGFEGSPAFATNLTMSMQQVGDQVANQFLQDLLSDTGKGDMIRSPFADNVGRGIATGFYLATSGQSIMQRLQYTLNDFTQNPNEFLYGDFSQGGWEAWHATNSECGNNVYCFQLAAHDDLVERVDREIDNVFRELEYGDGFFSWRGPCITYASGGTAPLNAQDRCLKQSIQTPGSVIETTLGITATSPLRQLELADSINEIVGALASQLVSQIMGGSGLLGSTQSPAGGGRTPLQLATDESQANTSAQVTALLRSFDTLRTDAESYRNSWQKIRTAAAQARVALDQCENEDDPIQVAYDAQIDATIARADSALALANDLLADIAEARTNLTSTTGTGAAGGNAAYLQLRARLPAAQIAEAVAESSENPYIGDSLYLQMQLIAQSPCEAPEPEEEV